MENGTNNTLNYNRVAGNTHNLHNNKKGTVNAEYNWWGQNTPTCITGMNINTGNHAVAVLNVPSGTINPGQIYNITVTLKSSTGEELKMEIPSFLVQFFINNGGDVYPETAPLINNSAWTQLQVFKPGTYTLTTTIDQQTLTNVLSTPVNSQPVTTNKIPRKRMDSGVAGDGMVMLGAMAEARASESGQSAEGNSWWSYINSVDKGIKSYYKYLYSFFTLGSSFNDYYKTLPPEIRKDPIFMAFLCEYQLYLATNSNTYQHFLYERMVIEPHDNIWEVINPPMFIKLYGVNYEHMDPTQKAILESFSGVDPQGDMSLLNFGLTALTAILMIVPGVDLLALAERLGISSLKIGIPFVDDTLKAIGRWASRNLKPVYNFLAKYLPKFGIGTKSFTDFAFDVVSRVTLPFGNPINWSMTILETLGKSSLIAPRFPWLERLVNSPTYTAISRFITVGDTAALVKGVTGITGFIWDGITTGFNYAASKIHALATGTVNKIHESINNGIKNAITIGNSMKTALQTKWNTLKAKATQGYNYVKAKVTQGYNYVKAKATQGYNYVKAKVTQGYNYVKAKATQGYNYVKAKVTQGYNYVANKVNDTVNWFKGAVGWH